MRKALASASRLVVRIVGERTGEADEHNDHQAEIGT
jgi:hypothetical protein